MAKKKQKNKGKQVNKTAVVDNISTDTIKAAISLATPPVIPVFLKVCRLCESKDGPFLNIFDADKVTAKKIDDLMPFCITENDDLPHKICFRCSAKLEELCEFIQKCIKTQENLRTALGKSEPLTVKSKMAKKLWEEKLNKSNMSNDDICDALIKKAMEGIKAIPSNTLPVEEASPSEVKRITRSKESAAVKKEVKVAPKSDDTDEVTLKQVKLSLGKHEDKLPSNKVTRSSKMDVLQTKQPEETPPKRTVTQSKKTEVIQSKKSDATQSKKLEAPQSTNSQSEKKCTEQKTKNSVNNLSFDYDEPATSATKESDSDRETKEEPKKPFNIMDYISMIKVNGVGILFQCKLCNRNFLKKEVVESHNCAKNGVPKLDIPRSVPAPELPKVPTVKYIKIDGDMKKSLTEKIKKAEQSENERLLSEENNTAKVESYEPPPKVKPKPKAGPASKTRRTVIDSDLSATQSSTEPANTDATVTPPSVHFPTMPNLNGRFKLVPGPNNIFTLVEDSSAVTATNNAVPTENPKKPSRKRKSDEVLSDEIEVKPKERNIGRDKPETAEIIDLEDTSKPYPVGLFQTVAHTARLYEPPVPEVPPTFTTPAMKKQSYTIVQTGNPSKLLISTKAKAAEMEVPRKRQRKTKPAVRDDTEAKEPYTVTIEDVGPPKDAGFFTFINVDPLLQPTYVLPTDNIIQESQISTSSAVISNASDSKESKDKEKYSCNMCGEHFSREKKLLTHIQSHYTKMDEEDYMRAEKTNKKKAKK